MDLVEPFRQLAEGSPAPMWCHLSTSSSPFSTPCSPLTPNIDAQCLLASTSLDLNEAPWTSSVQSPTYWYETAYSLQCNKWNSNQTIAGPTLGEPSTRITVHSAPSTAVVFSPCPPPTTQRLLASNLPDNPVLCDLISLNQTSSTAASRLDHSRRRSRKMEWRELDSEDLLFDDEHQPFPNDLPLPDHLLELAGDNDLLSSIDFRELENFLYPQTSSSNPVDVSVPTKQAALNCHASTSSLNATQSIDYSQESLDPLTEFFPDLANVHMPPHTSDHAQGSSQNFGVYGDIPYPQHQFDFLETPQQLDKYCKQESDPCSPISVGSPEGSPISSTSSRGPIQRRAAIVRVRASPYEKEIIDPVTDYRVKRDKNNVASARSRQKRQEKFSTMKKECSELEMKNVELRATLNTLEKSVQEYKNIMLAFMNKT